MERETTAQRPDCNYAEAERDEAELDRWDEYTALRWHLAAVNALLDRMRKSCLCPRTWIPIIEAHLSAQSEAPRNPYVCDPDCESPRCPVKVWEREHAQPAAPSRTEAEQKLAEAEAKVRELENQLADADQVTRDACAHSVTELESRLRELTKHHELFVDAIRRNYGDRLAAAEQKLADANALLEQIRGIVQDRITFPTMVRRIRAAFGAHLAGQPATSSQPAALSSPRCPAHDAVLANLAWFKCGCRYVQPAAPEWCEKCNSSKPCPGCTIPAAPSRPPLPARSISGRPELTEELPDEVAPSANAALRASQELDRS